MNLNTAGMLKVLIIRTAPADEEMAEGVRGSHHTQVASALFPSALCSAVAEIVSLLDDAAVSTAGCSVYEVAYQVKML